MKNTTIHATLTDSGVNLEAYAKCINNGRTDDVSFYVNGNRVSVSHRYGHLTAERQAEEIKWFLKGRQYTLNTPITNG